MFVRSLHHSFKETIMVKPYSQPTSEELRGICKECWKLPLNSMDEVYSQIYLGDSSAALCVSQLKREGITHIVNSAAPCDSCKASDFCGTCVMTKEAYYTNQSKISYKGIIAFDERRFPLWMYFDEITKFMDEAVKSGGKVLVHCQQGLSRSATLVIAYLMLKKNMSAIEAIKVVKCKRHIYPNPGFLGQICDLDLRLNRQRKYA